MVTEGTTRARDILTVDEVIEEVFADDNSEQEFFFSESDSDSSEVVSSEDSSAEKIGTDNIHSGTSITQATRRRGLKLFNTIEFKDSNVLI